MKNNTICYINRSTVDYDVRLKKYIEACKITSTPYIVISWDRLNDSYSRDEHEIQFKRYCPYGQGTNNLLSLFLWIIFVIKNLIKYKKRISVIHACNIENCIIAFWLKFFNKRIILDIYDSLNVTLEKYFAQKVDLLILPHKYRLKQIGIVEESVNKLLIVENVPTFSSDFPNCKYLKSVDRIKLSYVGVFEKEIRGIENILQFVYNNESMFLDIAGTGSGMDELVREYAKKCHRIFYHGKVSYDKALEIMNNSDFIVGLYYLKAPVHKYASPNKYYESLFLGTPIISSKGTLVGDRIYNDNTGYIIEDSLNGLEKLFSTIHQNDFIEKYKIKSDNCRKLWDLRYKDYKKSVLIGEYIRIVNTAN